MGYFFIDNEHDYDVARHYYCSCCKEHYNKDVEIATCSKCTSLTWQTLNDECHVITSINRSNIVFDDDHYKKIDIHPGTDEKFALLDLDPVSPFGIIIPIECRICSSELGWLVATHVVYENYTGLNIIKKKKVV